MNIFKQYQGLRKEIYVLFFARIVTCLGSMVFPLTTLILSNKLHMSASMIALLFLILSIVQLPFTYIAGHIADHYNKRNILIFCDSITIVCFFITGIIPLSMISVILIFTASIFAAIESPVFDALISDLSQNQEREKAFSLTYMGDNLGLVLAPTLAGFLFAKHLNLVFFIDSFSTLISTLLIFFFIKDVTVSHNENKDDYEKREEHISVLRVLKERKAIVWFIICIIFTQIVYSQFNFLMPLNFESLYGENGAAIFGTVTSVNAIIVIFATPVVTYISQKLGDVEKKLIGVILITFSLSMYIFIQNQMVMYYVSMIIFTFGEIYNTLGGQPYMSKRVPASHRGRLTSLLNISVNFSVTVSQNIIGYLIDSYSFVFVWTVIAIIGFITIVMIIYLKHIDKKEYPLLYNKNGIS